MVGRYFPIPSYHLCVYLSFSRSVHLLSLGLVYLIGAGYISYHHEGKGNAACEGRSVLIVAYVCDRKLVDNKALLRVGFQIVEEVHQVRLVALEVKAHVVGVYVDSAFSSARSGGLVAAVAVYDSVDGGRLRIGRVGESIERSSSQLADAEVQVLDLAVR